MMKKLRSKSPNYVHSEVPIVYDDEIEEIFPATWPQKQ